MHALSGVEKQIRVLMALKKADIMFRYILPCDRNPTSTSLASIKIFGKTKQNADTTCRKGAVGPPWCHALRTNPPDLARMEGGSIAHALSL